jgi:hypothetical protein
MAVTGQVAQDAGKSQDAGVQAYSTEQSQQRAAQIQKRIALTNEWSRKIRQGGLKQR